MIWLDLWRAQQQTGWKHLAGFEGNVDAACFVHTQRSACSSDSEREDVRDDGREEREENEGFSEGEEARAEHVRQALQN